MKSNKGKHRSGFVNIIGLPNVGKSTLMNLLLGDKLSIVTHKPQTTRHRILGILSEDDYQIIFSDVPGYVSQSSYRMHHRMNDFVTESLEDADVLLVMTEPGEKGEINPELLEKIRQHEAPKVLVVNKADAFSEEEVAAVKEKWTELIPFQNTEIISAREEMNTDHLLTTILDHLPEGPVYYPKDQISNRDLRFFVSEMIREQIFLQYRQEIPYSAEVDIERYVEKEDLVHIEAMIYVERKSQKYILIGKKGAAIKQVGIEARKNIEEFLGSKVFLELHVKVRDKWRDNENLLQKFGY